MTNPGEMCSPTCATTVMGTDAPLASVGVVQLTVPLLPTAGAVHDHPAGGLREANVVPKGNGSVSVTLWAAETPLFVTVIPYVRSLWFGRVAGAVFVTAKSAEGATVVVAVAELLPGFWSPVAAETEAVFVRTVPLGVPALTCTTS